jgi:phosphoacetylglucosamine mutase
VINAAVGDAVSDMFLVLAALPLLGIDAAAWNKLYTDLPSKMIKLPVADKNRIVCNEDETRAIAPLGLQNALDEAMRRVENGRCFVRPSGTEDVVRVYAEASTTEGVGRLIELSVQAINQYAN